MTDLNHHDLDHDCCLLDVLAFSILSTEIHPYLVGKQVLGEAVLEMFETSPTLAVRLINRKAWRLVT